jgi:hypothetical protein
MRLPADYDRRMIQAISPTFTGQVSRPAPDDLHGGCS